VDGWLRLRGWARIGVLVSRLRGLVDGIIEKKVENPGLDLGNDEVIKVVTKLVELDGLDA
jgi:ATP-dependent RNA helicase DHX57